MNLMKDLKDRNAGKLAIGILGVFLALAAPATVFAEAQNSAPKNNWFNWGASQKKTAAGPQKAQAESKKPGEAVEMSDKEEKEFENVTRGMRQIQDGRKFETARRTLSVQETNLQLENLVKMNNSMKEMGGNQSAEIHKISEQAKIHQKLLKNLEASKSSTPAVSVTDVDEILKQEKIRIIREQTEQNQRVIKSLDQKRSQ